MKNKKLSLQEQLLKSGLTTDAKAKQIRAEKRKQAKQPHHPSDEIVEQARNEAQNHKAEQQEKDRLLNQLKQEEAERKQLAAQIKQLIEQNKLAQSDNGVKYHFSDDGKVKTLYIDESLRNQIVNGRVAIVKNDGQYHLVPLETARKIEQRAAHAIVCLNEPTQPIEENDPYAAFQVPDDLMW
ncbi:MAG: DUF2058 domain-containing protein [Methylomicrobium sp.]